VDDVLHAERVVQVTPAPAGAKPRWGSVIPQLLSFEVCQQIRQVLISEEPYPYLDPRAAAVVEQLRSELGEPLRRNGVDLRVDENGAHWDTYAGGRINQTLKYALMLQHPDWKVTADSFGIRVQARSTPGPELMTAIDRLRTQIFWDDPQVQRGLLAGLPAYRLSKFQQALPDQLAFEVVASYLLDVPRTLAWLTQTG
jgi:ATP-dependent Lhr-like helicase